MKISDFAAQSGLTPDTIRYYERIGLLPRNVRDRSGRRCYGVDDLAWASFLCKLQAMDMPIRDRIQYSLLRAEGETTMPARRTMLEAHRATLTRRQAELAGLIAALDAKITHYRHREANLEGIQDDGSTFGDDGSGNTADGRRAGLGAERRG